MNPQPVHRIAAAVVLRPDGKVLLLKRSPTHTSNPDKWCFVTGYVDLGEEPREAAIRELREELGIETEPVRGGAIVVVHTDWGPTLHVHPFLFLVEQNMQVALEQEHVDAIWIEPQELCRYDFVQQLDEDLIALGLLESRQPPSD